MINAFKKLGEKKLNGLSPSERKKIFLYGQTISPYVPEVTNEDRDRYIEIIINLDLDKEEITIKQGEQLRINKKDDFFGFELLGRRSKKIYFTTNNLYYHMLTIPDIINYIDEKLNCKKYEDFVIYLKKVESLFYKSDSNKTYLDLDKFSDQQKNIIYSYIDKDIDYNYNTLSSALAEFVSKDILGSNKKDFINNINIFTVKINDKYITETEYNEQYINMIYYERQGRFFDKSENFTQMNKLCNVCGDKKLVTGKIDIPTKFYITDKPYFYENLDDNNAYKSFAICEECYQEVMLGIKEIQQDFSSKLFNNLDYYIIPKNINDSNYYKKTLNKVKRSLLGKNDEIEDDFKTLKTIAKQNLKFDFLFWYRPVGQAAAFVVAENINDIYYSRLKEIFSVLKNINLNYKEYLNYTPNINSIYWLLFPNKKSHNKVDSKVYRKEILVLFDSILKNREINYSYLLNNFNYIFKKRYYKENSDIKGVIDSPLQMNIILTWLNSIAILDRGFKMKEGQKSISITNEDIKSFFEVHKDIYAGNYYRQGLFILGYLINQVLKKQVSKSSTIINKIDFDGLGVKRVKRFVLEVTESLEIYDQYRDNQVVHAQMMDRIQGIENSSLNKDEVVFYILSGVSYGRYLGYKYNQEKNKKKGDEDEDGKN
ncbi:MAG: TM1802 family CRISPR-associated protein [bacterium]